MDYFFFLAFQNSVESHINVKRTKQNALLEYMYVLAGHCGGGGGILNCE